MDISQKLRARIERTNGNSDVFQVIKTKEDIDKLLDVADTMNGKTICVFAPAVSTVITSFISKFRDEFEAAL